jgi:hypothetical protein
MKDLTIMLDDTPGSLAALAEAMGSAGVNIEGICAFAENGRAVAHLCVDDARGARRALEGAGYEISAERDVIVVAVQDRPGVLGGVTRRIAGAGVNLELLYLATGTRVVVAADDLDKAETAV